MGNKLSILIFRIVSLFILFVMPVVSLLTLFTEPRVGKVQAKGLEGDSSHRNYSRFILFWLAQQL